MNRLCKVHLNYRFGALQTRWQLWLYLYAALAGLSFAATVVLAVVGLWAWAMVAAWCTISSAMLTVVRLRVIAMMMDQPVIWDESFFR